MFFLGVLGPLQGNQGRPWMALSGVWTTGKRSSFEPEPSPDSGHQTDLLSRPRVSIVCLARFTDSIKAATMVLVCANSWVAIGMLHFADFTCAGELRDGQTVKIVNFPSLQPVLPLPSGDLTPKIFLIQNQTHDKKSTDYLFKYGACSHSIRRLVQGSPKIKAPKRICWLLYAKYSTIQSK